MTLELTNFHFVDAYLMMYAKNRGKYYVQVTLNCFIFYEVLCSIKCYVHHFGKCSAGR